MAIGRFRQYRGERTRGGRFDGDTFHGTGEAPRQSHPIDEGDRRMCELIEQMKDIELRPDAPPEPAAS